MCIFGGYIFVCEYLLSTLGERNPNRNRIWVSWVDGIPVTCFPQATRNREFSLVGWWVMFQICAILNNYYARAPISSSNAGKIVAGSQRFTSGVGHGVGIFGLFGKCNHFFFKLHAMLLKKFIAATCQSLIRKVFTTPRACGKPDVGVRTTTNSPPAMN